MSLSSTLRFLLLFSLFTYGLSNHENQQCPPQEDIYPCQCVTRSNGLYIECVKIANERDVVDALKGTRGYWLKGVSFKDSTFQFLPHDAFYNTTFLEFELLGSGLLSLSDTEEAFKGLENFLNTILIRNCIFLNGWNWEYFIGLKMLTTLQFIDGDLLALTEDVSKLHTLPLATINFSRNRISWLEKEVFAKFKGLHRLFLYSNEIKEITRSMLPQPANHLSLINLSHNKIRNLPNDFFTDMPSLKMLFLTGNLFHTIEEETFRPVFDRLFVLDLEENPLSCDCRISWLPEAILPKDFTGACQSPASLEGKDLKLLQRKELRCYR